MAQRVLLHVGTPKSGTTHLQSVWWANRRSLQAQGLLLPGESVREHFWASCVVRGDPRLLSSLPPGATGAWDRVVAATREADGDVLISHELFSRASPDRARAALARLRGAAGEVHVVLTARDLARQVPAEWQQRTKHGRSQTYARFVEEVRTDPGSRFWQAQDVPAVLERWSEGVPPDRVHLVVLPPPGGPQSLLWDQLCVLTGVDGTGMAARAVQANVSLGLVEAETMRRLCAELALGHPEQAKATERLLKGFVAEEILRSADPERIVLPPSAHAWVAHRARHDVDALAGRGYHVVGDLDDLLPDLGDVRGRDPSEVGEAEVAAVAVRALARFVEHERDAEDADVHHRVGPVRALAARLRSRLSPGVGR